MKEITEWIISVIIWGSIALFFGYGYYWANYIDKQGITNIFYLPITLVFSGFFVLYILFLISSIKKNPYIR